MSLCVNIVDNGEVVGPQDKEPSMDLVVCVVGTQHILIEERSKIKPGNGIISKPEVFARK